MALFARRRPRPLTLDERRLWAHAIRDVEPLPGQRLDTLPEPEPPPAPEPKPPAAPKPVLSVRPVPARPAPDTRPAWEKGLDARTADRLRRGKLEIEARLDLHGMRQAEAHNALVSFLLGCYAAGRRVALVITGRGRFSGGEAVLQRQVPRWLADPPLRDLVLSIRPAQPRHGGAGAIYILLRRRRDA